MSIFIGMASLGPRLLIQINVPTLRTAFESKADVSAQATKLRDRTIAAQTVQRVSYDHRSPTIIGWECDLSSISLGPDKLKFSRDQGFIDSPLSFCHGLNFGRCLAS
jgi:hypothetical protein